MSPYSNYKLNSNSLDNLLEGFQLIGYDWKYLFVNDTVVKQGKRDKKEDLLGKTMMECYPGIEASPMFKTLETCMKTRKDATLLNEFVFPGGGKGWFELRIEPVPEGLFILSIDVTKRMLAESEKDRYMKGIEEMLFITSHKVRQPLASIMGMTDLLNKEDNSQDDLRKIAEYMKTSVESLDTYTKELTNFITDLNKKMQLTNVTEPK